ncbi:MAG: 50S ribosomal protein L11 methyltransferase [Chloroflexi bacterium]|nr:50S ribosomal protein L11 methyltransferase [Chloroflexota bacterium]
MTEETKRWIEISVQADREAVDDLVGLFNRHCRGGAIVEQKVDERSGDPSAYATVKGFLPTWDEETLHKLEVALMLLARVTGVSEPKVRTLEPEDWSESWKAYFEPQRIGQHTAIVPTWREYTPQPGETIVRIDPGMAFGTGLHATTRLCLVALEQLPLAEVTVLDVGTGSGILAIAAALQGARQIDALDIDAVSVEVAQANAALNHVADRVHIARGTLRGSETSAGMPVVAARDYDLVLANILAEVIIALAPALADALAPGGTLVASGIIGEKGDAVAQALSAAGLTVAERLVENDWLALIARKP